MRACRKRFLEHRDRDISREGATRSFFQISTHACRISDRRRPRFARKDGGCSPVDRRDFADGHQFMLSSDGTKSGGKPNRAKAGRAQNSEKGGQQKRKGAAQVPVIDQSQAAPEQSEAEAPIAFAETVAPPSPAEASPTLPPQPRKARPSAIAQLRMPGATITDVAGSNKGLFREARGRALARRRLRGASRVREAGVRHLRCAVAEDR